MRPEWIIAPPAPDAYRAALTDLHPLTVQTLYARGFTQPDAARAFVQGRFDPVDPFVMRGMRAAVDRIARAIRSGERIAIYGDYDCDGVTACALLKRTLDSLGAPARVYIPNRFDEGYGLNADALDTLKAEGVGLVVTVDCGARAAREAAHAAAIGLDLIITDHHELDGRAIPEALALVNPRHPECAYPFKSLAGVGVAFRLAQCLLRTMRAPGQISERALLDLVALGTVADVVSMTGENRLLVSAGLAVINSAPRAGLEALMRAAGVARGGVDAGKIGFTLAPRLNAAGRLESALAAYELLTCDDPSRATEVAAQLNAQNEQRQSVTADVARDAETRAMATDTTAPLLFAAAEGYNAGVIGLAAARLVEKHYRPAVVVAIHNGEARGSCRSVKDFHITQALDACAGLLTRHGGHAAAAGFTLPAERLDDLRASLIAIAREAQPADGWRRHIRVEAETDLSQLNRKALTELARLEPFGIDNPRPVFVARQAEVVSARRVGKAAAEGGQPHLQVRLKDSRRAVWDAVAWRAGERHAELRSGECIDLAFHLDENEWNGERKLQLVLQDFRMA